MFIWHNLSEQFKSVFTRDDPQTADKKLSGSGHPTIPPLTIDTNGVVKLLHNLNPRKASGPDEVPARLLQSLAAEVAPALTLIFEQTFSQASFPHSGRKHGLLQFLRKVLVLNRLIIDLCH